MIEFNQKQKHDTLLQKVHDAVEVLVSPDSTDYRKYVAENGIYGKPSKDATGTSSKICSMLYRELIDNCEALSDDCQMSVIPLVLFPTDLLHLLTWPGSGLSADGKQVKVALKPWWNNAGLVEEDLCEYLIHNEVGTKTILLTAKSTKNLWKRFNNGGAFLIFGKGTSNKMMDLSSRKVLDGEDVDTIADEIAVQLGGNFICPIEDALFLLDGANEKGSVNVHKAQGGRLALHATGYLNGGSIKCIVY